MTWKPEVGFGAIPQGRKEEENKEAENIQKKMGIELIKMGRLGASGHGR